MELDYRNNYKSLFRKYAHLVTWFANTSVGKEYLELPNENIALLLPNGYHAQKDTYLYEAKFYTRPIFSPRLTPALRVIDFISSYLTSITEAKTVLLESLGISKPLITRAFSFATDNFNPDADPESTSVDGVAQRTGSNLTWTDIRDGNGTNGADTGSSDNMPFFTSDSSSNRWGVNSVGLFLYDTSSIPDTNEIVSATNQYFTGATSTNQLNVDVGLGTCNPASNTAIVSADYQTRGYTRQASDIAWPSAMSSYSFTLNPTGIASITKTGITKFCVMTDADLDNTPPTWASGQTTQLTTILSDAGGSKPVLTVTHNAPVPGGFIFISS